MTNKVETKAKVLVEDEITKLRKEQKVLNKRSKIKTITKAHLHGRILGLEQALRFMQMQEIKPEGDSLWPQRL